MVSIGLRTSQLQEMAVGGSDGIGGIEEFGHISI